MMDAFSVASNETRLDWGVLAGRGEGAGLPKILARPSTRYMLLARNAIFHCLGLPGIEPGQTVLVPAYYCAAFVEPILAYGAHVVFYKVGLDCMPDLADVAMKVDERTRAIVAVHYFGFPVPIEALLTLCEARQLFLIEDCAHVLIDRAAGSTLGSHGHISVFSFRKFLPLQDGACLVINADLGAATVRLRPEGWRQSARTMKNLVEKLCADSDGATARVANGLLARAGRVSRRLFPQPVAASGAPTLNLTAPVFDAALADLPMSHLSQRVLRNSALERIVQQRRANYEYLLQATEGLAGLCIPSLCTGPAPGCSPSFRLVLKTCTSNCGHVASRPLRGIASFIPACPSRSSPKLRNSMSASYSFPCIKT